MPLIEYPHFETYREAGWVGVFVEGCVIRGDGSSFRRRAHAHTKGPHKGIICVRSRKRLYTSKGGVSDLMKHELAHILTLHGHTDKWRAKLRELGGKVRWWERKRPRPHRIGRSI